MWHDEFERLDLDQFARGLCVRFHQKQTTKTKETSGYQPWQEMVAQKVGETYAPYVGQGTLGGLGDLEESALDMLRSADIWSPMVGAGKGLLTGEAGAQPISAEEASRAFAQSVEQPTLQQWSETWRPQVKEAFSGPGYWGSARPMAEAQGMREVGQWLGGQRANWMWNAEQANRALQEAKAGRALSALGVVPSSLLGWTGGLFGTGRQAQEILNQITDPQVLQALEYILGRGYAGVTTRKYYNPSQLEQGMPWTKIGASMIGGAAGGGGMAM